MIHLILYAPRPLQSAWHRWTKYPETARRKKQQNTHKITRNQLHHLHAQVQISPTRVLLAIFHHKCLRTICLELLKYKRIILAGNWHQTDTYCWWKKSCEPVALANTLQIYTPEVLTAKAPKNHGGTGRRSGFLLGWMVTFQGRLLLNFGRVTEAFLKLLSE